MKWGSKITSSQLLQNLIRKEKALFLFDPIASHSNGETLSIMISKFLASSQFEPAFYLLNRMKSQNLDCPERIFISFFKSYAKSHRAFEALNLFHKMKDFDCLPTQESYVSIFSMLVSENQLKMAFRFHRFMLKMGVGYNLISVNVLIKALCKSPETLESAFRVFREMGDHGCVPDTYTYNTLINGLSSFGRLTEAKELAKEMMIGKKYEPNVITYTCLINGFLKFGDVNEAFRILNEMNERGIEANEATFCSLVDGLCRNGMATEGLKVVRAMRRKNLTPTMVNYRSLVSGLCNEGKVKDAIEVLDMTKLQELKVDVDLYSKIIGCLCDLGTFSEAADFLDEMVLYGIFPNNATRKVHEDMHNMLVRGLCGVGDGKRAMLVYRRMRTSRLSVDLRSYDRILEWLCKKEELYGVAQIVREMVAIGRVPDELTWKTLVDAIWGGTGVGKEVDLMIDELIVEVHGTPAAV